MSNTVVSNVTVFGLEDSIKASKYPMAVKVEDCNPDMTQRVLALAGCATGTGHDQFLTGIIVQFDLTFSNKAWVEMQRYHFIDFVSSQSTMHRISRMDLCNQCNEYVDPRIIAICEELKDRYLETEEMDDYLRLLYNIPSGFRITARMTTNYRQLKTIYQQRKNHRLPEWREFCQWVETLPHSELIIGCSEEKED